MTEDDDLPADCAAFVATVNAVLDGDAPASELRSDHARECSDCRGVAVAARLLASAGPVLTAPPVVPAELTVRLAAASARPRMRRWSVPTLAVCAAVGVWLSWPARPTPEPVAVAPSGPAPRVADQWAAVTSVARHAGERAAAPARLLDPARVNLPTTDVTPPTEQAAVALTTLGQAARAGADPVAGTTRRAVDLFLRDFGLAGKPAS